MNRNIMIRKYLYIDNYCYFYYFFLVDNIEICYVIFKFVFWLEFLSLYF